MEKESSPTWQYVKLVLFALGLMELFLFSLAVVFSRQVGYATAFSVCAWFGAVVAAVFVFIMLINAVVIGIEKLHETFNRKKTRQNQQGDDRE